MSMQHEGMKYGNIIPMDMKHGVGEYGIEV